MDAAKSSHRNFTADLGVPLPRFADPLWALIYRSHPRNNLGQPGYTALLRQARQHNRTNGISGALVVGKDESGSPELVQWLEGPAPAIRDLMAKITVDSRHSDVKVFDSFPLRRRLFENWSMLFADEDPHNPIIVEQGLLGRTRTLVDLRSGSSGLLDAFTSLSMAGRNEVTPDTLLCASSSSLLLPHAEPATEARHKVHFVGHRFPAVTESVSQNDQDTPLLISALTHLVLSHNQQSIESLLRRSSRTSVDPLAAQILMLEQTERRLGDMWEADECSEIDITLALADMVSAMRSIHFDAIPAWQGSGATPAVLVISEPGEFHFLPAILGAEMLYQRGWNPQLDFPANDQEVVANVEHQWFEAIEISLSDVFRREQWLPRLAETIAQIRMRSLNRHIVITVSGRICRDRHSLLSQIGADRLLHSASEIERSIVEALQNHPAY